MQCKVVHYTLEYTPSVLYTIALLNDWVSVSLNLVLLCLFWRCFCIEVLYQIGLVRALFGMEFICGLERAQKVSLGSESIETSVILMTQPDNGLEQFAQHVRSHFKKFTRCCSDQVQVSHSYFFREVHDKTKLDAMVKVMDQDAFDISDIERFVADQ